MAKIYELQLRVKPGPGELELYHCAEKSDADCNPHEAFDDLVRTCRAVLVASTGCIVRSGPLDIPPESDTK